MLMFCHADVNATDNFCFVTGDCSILEHLMFCHADVNATDNFGLTPLHYACSRGNVRSVQKLLTSEFIDVQVLINIIIVVQLYSITFSACLSFCLSACLPVCPFWMHACMYVYMGLWYGD